MESKIQEALNNDRVIDITTIGRKSGKPTRKEIWFHNLDGEIYITGRPGKRDWYANLIENPEFTFHLKNTVEADLDARATPITAEDDKRAVLTRILERLDNVDQLDQWVARSPLVKVEFR